MFKRGQQSNPRMKRGAGIVDTAKNVIEKVKSGFNKAKSLYTSETGVALRNLVPQGNPDARPSFSGEMHAVLQDPKSYTGYTTANWAGPGTNVKARLLRGDRGITECDTASKAHDIRFSLAKNDPKKIREADMKMINAVKKSKDTPFNKAITGKIIQAKIISEKLGIKNKFGESAPLSPEDEDLYTRELEKLETQGYGYRKLTRHANKVYEKDKKVSKGHVKKLDSRPFKGTDGIKKSITKITLSGSGITDVLDSVIGTVVPDVLNQVTRKYGITKPSPSLVFDAKKLFMKNLVNKPPSQYNQIIASTIFPAIQQLLTPILQNKGGSRLAGKGFFADLWDGVQYGWNSVLGVAENIPPIEGVDVGAIAKKIPKLGVTTMADLKARKRARDNAEQADRDTEAQKGQVVTEAQRQEFNKFQNVLIPDMIAKLKESQKGKGIRTAGIKSRGKGVINAGVRSTKGRGVRTAGGEYNAEDVKNMANMLVEKIKNSSSNIPVTPESLLSKIKKYVPKVALGAVAVLVGKKLFNKANEKFGDFLISQGKQVASDMWRNAKKGNGVKTAGVKGGKRHTEKSDLSDLQSNYNKLISKYI